MNARPNILVVLVDQMRYHAMEPAGNSQIHTPNLNRLSREGIQFTNAVSNIPVCTPARACLLTGLYPLSHSVLTNNSLLPHDIPSMGTLLKKQGYDTAYIGKWHLAGEAFIGATESNCKQNGYIPPGPYRHGFDFWAVHHCSHNYWNATYYRDTPEPIQIEGWETDGQTDIAIDFLRQKVHRKSPFAMVVSWGTPHTPFIAPEEYKTLYSSEKLTFRPNVPVTQEVVDNVEYHLEKEISPEKLLREHTLNYYAAISNIDYNLGRLLDEIKRLEIEKNTIVVFTSDHGEMLGSHGQWSKLQPWDESVCIPMLIRYPEAIKSGQNITTPFSLTDVLPTVLGLAGIKNVAKFEGTDFSPLLRNENLNAPKSAFLIWPCSAVSWGKKWTYCTDMGGSAPCRGFPEGFLECYRGIRSDNYTYVRRHNKPWMLYDNASDPYQLRNLVEIEGPDAVPADLEQELNSWLELTGDEFQSTDYYKDLIELETGLIRNREALKK